MLLPLHRCILLAVSFAMLACSSGDEVGPEEQQHREFAKDLVLKISNYTPETIKQNLTVAGPLLSGSARKVFAAGVLDSEYRAVKSTGRSQSFTVYPEEIASELQEGGGTLVEIPGERVRTVKGKTSKPIRLSYLIEVRAAPNAKLTATSVIRRLEPGQAGALGEEALLEKFNEASSAAAEERQKFLETVDAVHTDLKAHEKKVEKDFQRLSNSLDKLGSKVRQLGDGVRNLKKKPRDKRRTTKPADSPPVDTPQAVAPPEEEANTEAAAPTDIKPEPSVVLK